MAKTPVVRVTFVGDSTNAQKSMQDLAGATGQAQISVEGFGKAFARMGLALGAAGLLKQAADGIADYSQKVQTAEVSIAALTKSQAAVTRAQALANRELEAGRAAYSDTLVALDALTPVSLRTGVAIEDLYRTSQLLATLNSGPGGGVEGAIVAISEALSGDWTSAIERFNLPRAEINKLKAEGVPALEILNRTLAQSGVTMETVGAKALTAAVQQKILLDTLAKIGTESGGKEGLDLFTTALVGLNKELQSPAVKEFAVGLRQLIELASTGEFFQDFGIQTAKAFFLVGDAFNNMIKAISGGKINIDGPLADFRAQIVADEGKLRTTVRDRLAQPIADEASGKAPGSPIAPAAMQGYGRDILANITAGMTEGQSDALQQIGKVFEDLFKDSTGKVNADALAQATSVLAVALHEVADGGQLTETTLYRLTTIYGAQTPEVQKLVVAYGQLATAQQRAKDAADGLAGAEYNLTQVQNRAKGDLAGYEAAVTSAQQAAANNAQAAEDAIAPLEAALAGVRSAAEDAARAGQDQLRGLQDDLDGLQRAASQRAAEFQQQIDAAQEAVQAAHDRRTTNQGLYQAALKGETEEYLRQLDLVDEQTRAIAAKWDAEIGGARRAKEGADQKVTDLTRQAHREDRDALHKINELRQSGHEKEARAAERALAARQKQRAAALQLAQADAAVANDEFDATKERVDKEAQAQDEKDAAAEKSAQKNLTAIQAQAQAQADADRAAIQAQQDRIKAVQDQQAADARRSADAQRNIQAEIDKIKDQATEQAKKDKQAIIDAQTLLTNQQTYWNTVTTGAQAAVNLTGGIKTNADGLAAALKEAYEWEQKRYALYAANPPGSPGGPPKPQQVAPTPPPTQTSPYDETPPLVPPPPPQPQAPGPLEGRPPAPAGLLPIYDAAIYLNKPNRYHRETAPDGHPWWVPDGHTIAEYPEGRTPVTPPPSPGGPGGLSRVGGLESFSAGSPQFSRASLAGGSQAGAGQVVVLDGIHLHLPNVRDLGDPSQRATIWRAFEKELHEALRGGQTKRDQVS